MTPSLRSMEPQTPGSHDCSNSKHHNPLQSPANLEKQNMNHEKAIENFQELIFKIAETRKETPLTPTNKNLVRDHVNQLFSQYKTPDHPPYHEMIVKALWELTEKGGSSMETISQFLKIKYADLPLAHMTLLERHLVKLCESGDIILTRSKKYLLPSINPSRSLSTKYKKEQVIETRNERKGEKVDVIEKYCEYDVQENRLSKKRLIFCDDQENVSNPKTPCTIAVDKKKYPEEELDESQIVPMSELRWSWGRETNGQCKEQVIETIKQRESDEIDVTEKHCESDVQEKRLIKKSLIFCDDDDDGETRRANANRQLLFPKPHCVIAANEKKCPEEVNYQQKKLDQPQIVNFNVWAPRK